jgi:hypothetical protein
MSNNVLTRLKTRLLTKTLKLGCLGLILCACTQQTPQTSPPQPDPPAALEVTDVTYQVDAATLTAPSLILTPVASVEVTAVGLNPQAAPRQTVKAVRPKAGFSVALLLDKATRQVVGLDTVWAATQSTLTFSPERSAQALAMSQVMFWGWPAAAQAEVYKTFQYQGSFSELVSRMKDRPAVLTDAAILELAWQVASSAAVLYTNESGAASATLHSQALLRNISLLPRLVRVSQPDPRNLQQVTATQYGPLSHRVQVYERGKRPALGCFKPLPAAKTEAFIQGVDPFVTFATAIGWDWLKVVAGQSQSATLMLDPPTDYPKFYEVSLSAFAPARNVQQPFDRNPALENVTGMLDEVMSLGLGKLGQGQTRQVAQAFYLTTFKIFSESQELNTIITDLRSALSEGNLQQREEALSQAAHHLLELIQESKEVIALYNPSRSAVGTQAAKTYLQQLTGLGTAVIGKAAGVITLGYLAAKTTAFLVALVEECTNNHPYAVLANKRVPVDLGLVIDTSYSMTPHLGTLKTKLKAVLDALVKQGTLSRYGLTEFRDGTELLNRGTPGAARAINALTGNVNEIKASIDSLLPSSNNTDDPAEDYYAGLNVTQRDVFLDCAVIGGVRLMLVVSDGPAKDPNVDGKRLSDLLPTLNTCDTRVIGLYLGAEAKTTMQRLAKATNAVLPDGSLAVYSANRTASALATDITSAVNDLFGLTP